MNVEIYSMDGEKGNIYLINADNSNEVIVIDPGIFNSDLLNIIEAKDRIVKHVLITHSHPHCQKGLETLLKIYRANVYYPGNLLNGEILSQNGTLTISGCDVEVISIDDENETNFIFRINRSLFVGDLLSAGKIQKSGDYEENESIRRDLHNAFAKLEGFFYIFPGHGPPSTLDIESKNLGF